MSIVKTQPQCTGGKLLSWMLTGVMALLCTILAMIGARVVAILANMFHQLEVELPWPTRFLLASYAWLLPLLFGSLGIFVVWKEFSTRELRDKFVLTARVFFAVATTVGGVALVLYLPVLMLGAKLAK